MSNYSTLTQHDFAWAFRKIPIALKEQMISNPARIFVAGGFIRASIANEPINDIDIFVDSPERAKSLAFDLAAPAHMKSDVKRTENAITLPAFKPTLQIIHRWTFSNAVSLINSFDFTCCRAALWWNGDTWDSICDTRFYPDLAAKRLVYCAPERDEDAGGSALRVLKYYQRGYRIPLDSYAKVIARLVGGCTLGSDDLETQIQRRLREIDPSVDPAHAAHLPADDNSPSDLDIDPLNINLAPAELSPKGNS